VASIQEHHAHVQFGFDRDNAAQLKFGTKGVEVYAKSKKMFKTAMSV